MSEPSEKDLGFNDEESSIGVRTEKDLSNSRPFLYTEARRISNQEGHVMPIQCDQRIIRARDHGQEAGARSFCKGKIDLCALVVWCSGVIATMPWLHNS